MNPGSGAGSGGTTGGAGGDVGDGRVHGVSGWVRLAGQPSPNPQGQTGISTHVDGNVDEEHIHQIAVAPLAGRFSS